MACARRIALLLALLPACGGETISLGEGRPRTRDGGGGAVPADADTQADDAPDEPEPEPAEDAGTERDGGDVRFAAPMPIAELVAPDAADDDPSLTSDLTLLYFNSKRDGGAGREDVWYTTRASTREAWSAPVPATELNTDARETGIALSADGLTLWFSSDRPGGEGGLDVYVARRARRADAFTDLVRVDALSTAGDDLISAISGDQRTAYLARRDNEDDDYDLYMAERRDAQAAFDEPVAIAALNGDGEESDASPAEGGRSLLFTRDAELQLAVRDARGAYVVVGPLDALNSGDNERDAWATDDLRYMVFSSNRTGTYLLYEARR